MTAELLPGAAPPSLRSPSRGRGSGGEAPTLPRAPSRQSQRQALCAPILQVGKLRTRESSSGLHCQLDSGRAWEPSDARDGDNFWGNCGRLKRWGARLAPQGRRWSGEEVRSTWP